MRSADLAVLLHQANGMLDVAERDLELRRQEREVAEVRALTAEIDRDRVVRLREHLLHAIRQREIAASMPNIRRQAEETDARLAIVVRVVQ